MDQVSIGVLGASGKENERRRPIHPRHFQRIDADLRERIYLESGYAEDFGVSDADLARQVAGVRSRAEIVAGADVIVLPKPTLADVADLRDGQVLWGWPHCVQDRELTQLAIDKKLTLIAWEAMNHWRPDGTPEVHVFHANNELAGYCSVLHALTLVGATSLYGRKLTAAVIGFGNAARGAINGLHALGVHDITALTMRDLPAVASPIPSVVLGQLDRDEDDPSRTIVVKRSGPVPADEFLAQHDLVVNCVLQDTDRPMMFITYAELVSFDPGSVIIDVSCDEGMGFEFARPTSFDAPMFTVGPGVHYYGVDHTPSYLWDSATWVISEALLPYLPSVMAGPAGWDADITISSAIEIRDGVIHNPKILTFQGRDADYPHAVTAPGG
jgi:alanine dehydrogenase